MVIDSLNGPGNGPSRPQALAEHDHNACRGRRVPNGQFAEIEILRDDQPIPGIGQRSEITVDCASCEIDNMDNVMTALAKRQGEPSRAAFVQKETHAYSAAKVALPRRTSAA